MLQSVRSPQCAEPWLGETDIWLLREGKHLRPWEKLGAHPCHQGGVAGTVFAVWAPNARQVAVVGDFNDWRISTHVMQPLSECGAWVLFIPGVAEGALYKFSVLGADGLRHFKTDPYAFCSEGGPGHAGVVMTLPAPVSPPAHRVRANALSAPISIYEVHVGSWRRQQGQWPNWQTLARTLIPYAVDMGFTHLELMPITEHPFYGSWGYQPTGLYAPSARYGSPQAFREFIAIAHAAGLLVLLDWVPAHFPGDTHALSRFDGTPQYEHADPREGIHRDWDTLIYNYGRHEVRNFLVGNALFWIERYGIDGLRVDAVASMLYRDYSRPEGEWIPNRHGGRENYEAIHFLREVNRVIGEEVTGAITLAEESTAFSGVTRPPWMGGLGFNFKWNLGWMHDTLAYFSTDPVHRQHHHDLISFAMMYAYSEHFVLPLSHDEVVHGKGALISKMWGDPWQKYANLRALYALMFAHPGRKLLFMGNELAQAAEWDHDAELDWQGLADPQRAGVQRLVRELNSLYRSRPALHSRDDEFGGFSWLDVEDRAQSIFSFARFGLAGDSPVVVVCNLTPVVRHGYRVGLPQGGIWCELLNTDAGLYGGSGVVNPKVLPAQSIHWQGRACSLLLSLPPLGVVWLELEATP